ncbi:hypothetical protein PG997_010333 [Apiospora hydei]|uniref:Uncharacterized protein n=1 Tax=Apiospora hydei TaxID=1337664 RepID=A0ABR1VWN1_9PEZI
MTIIRDCKSKVVFYSSTIYGLFFIRGYLRQGNQFLKIPRSQVLKMSDKMKALLGYKMTPSLLGMVESLDPITNVQ